MTSSFVIFFLCFFFRTDEKLRQLNQKEATKELLKMMGEQSARSMLALPEGPR